MKFKSLYILLLLIFATPLIYAKEVNLYSARKEKLIKPLLDRFTEKTGIKVNLVTGKADALLKRLEAEGLNTPADLFITTDAGRLYRAKSAKVLQPVTSRILLALVPANLRDPQNYWFGLSKRVRPILYVKNKVQPEELSTYENLADKKWRGRICIRSSSNIYNQSLVASMIAHNGPEQTEDWAKRFVANLAIAPRGGDRDQIKAAAAGLCDIAIANTYYLGKMLHGKDPAQKAAAKKVSVFWPNQNGRGAHINISGVGLVKHAKNVSSAVKLMEFLVNPKSQAWYAKANHEYPLRDDIAWSPTLQTWGKFVADELNLSKLGKLNAAAVKLMDRAGWQ